MTTDKARKRAVRDRMTKTGESYTAARRHLAPPEATPDAQRADPAGEAGPAAPTSAEAPPPVAPLPARVVEPEVSEEAILRATGRDWDHWLRVLDARGTEGFSHRDTAAWLRTELGIDGWWAQTITIGFERARGLRAAYQMGDGFSVGVSKTLPVSAGRLWAAFADEEGRSRWLDPGLLQLRTAQPGRTARFDVAGGSSRVVVGFTAKGDAKSSVSIQHERLGSAAEVEERRTFWRERLAALGDLVAAEAAASRTGVAAARAQRVPAARAAAPVPHAPGAAPVPHAPGAAPAGAPVGAAPASPLDEYLLAIDPAHAARVVELDALVRATAPELGAAVKYRMLTYAIGGNWWRWVCAISVTTKAVNLRLLYGTRLESGVGILRPGSSHLANLDVAPGAVLDADLVTRLVREAVDRHAEFLASEGSGRG